MRKAELIFDLEPLCLESRRTADDLANIFHRSEFVAAVDLLNTSPTCSTCGTKSPSCTLRCSLLSDSPLHEWRDHQLARQYKSWLFLVGFIEAQGRGRTESTQRAWTQLHR